MNEMTTDPAANFADMKFSEQLDRKAGEFALAIPRDSIDRPVLSPDRFVRALWTTVSMVPKLLRADRRSFWDAASRCAIDGLLPDGREAALVPFLVSRRDGKEWMKILLVQYIPMVGGYRRLVREAGIDWQVRVVHQKDKFAHEYGDAEHIEHVPSSEDDPGPWTHVYAIARQHGEVISREVMNRAAVFRIRDRSPSWKNADEKERAKSAWAVWEEEMALKTVAKKQVKVLPLGTDSRILGIIRREDVDERGDNTIRVPAIASTGSLSDKMRALADQREKEALAEEDVDDDVEDLDQDGDVINKATGEITKPAATAPPEPQRAAAAPEATPPSSSQQAVEASGATNTAPAVAPQEPPDQAPPAATAPAAPTPAAGAGPALRLTAEQAKAIRKFAEMLIGAQSQRTVQKGTVNFLEDEGYAEGSEAEAAVVAIRDAHLARVAGKGSPAECDAVRDRVTRL